MTQQKDVLTIDQKIAIARIAIEGLNSCLIGGKTPRAVFDISDKYALFPAAYNYLVDFLTSNSESCSK